ncbi:MAG: tetratricopeptide repeat protein [Candidatus Rokubacteria bacterium]|nr:tetratricopeptide repeat protein [Candidatus Rokubacteria bacterium]
MSLGSISRSLSSWLRSLGTLASTGPELARLADSLGLDWRRWSRRRTGSARDEVDVAALLDRARAAREARRTDEAITLYREALGRDRSHVAALRGLREVAVAARRWSVALEAQERLVGVVPAAERGGEFAWLAVVHYERGREELGADRASAALAEFKQALRADRQFVPAAVALGDVLDAAGDTREAMRVWERAAEATPSLPLLARLERVYRQEGRPSRMIALYRGASERAPDDLGLAAALGRVYFELEMLDEAADQFEKLDVRAPDLPVIHAFLGAIFERRGDTREAFDEYRRALRLAHSFTWPHRCAACAALAPSWEDRCRACGRWNTLRPADGR